MAKKKARSRFISVDDHEKYSRSSGGKYFKLADDGDSAKVRFMFRKPEDVKVCGATVHSLEINGAYPTVRCLRSYDEPRDVCPLCREGYETKVRYFVPIYNIDADRVQIFNRGQDFVKMIARKAVRYAKKGEVAQCIFELVRNGEKGSMQTTYDAEFDDKDKTTLDDLPDYEEVLDSILLDKSEDDMEYFLESGEFPPEDEVKPRRGKKVVEEDEDDDDDYDEDDDEIDDDDEEDDDDDDEEDEEDEDDDFDEEEDDDEDEDDEDEDDDLEDEDEDDEDERPVRKSASKAKSKAVQRRVPAKKGKRK